MRRATTPTHEFTLGIDANLISKIRITYAQGGSIVLTKNLEDVTIEGNVVKVNLTQDETRFFNTEQTVEIQVRIITTGNDALTSNIILTRCERVIDGGEM